MQLLCIEYMTCGDTYSSIASQSFGIVRLICEPSPCGTVASKVSKVVSMCICGQCVRTYTLGSGAKHEVEGCRLAYLGIKLVCTQWYKLTEFLHAGSDCI